MDFLVVDPIEEEPERRSIDIFECDWLGVSLEIWVARLQFGVKPMRVVAKDVLVDVEFLVDVRIFGRGNYDRNNGLRRAVIDRSASTLDDVKPTYNKLGGIFFGVGYDLIGEIFWLD